MLFQLLLLLFIYGSHGSEENGVDQNIDQPECPDLSDLGCKCSIHYPSYKERGFRITCNGVFQNGVLPDWTPLKGLPISELELHDNNINEIPDDAFNGLYFFSPLMPFHHPELDLYNNSISKIGENAFRGIQTNGLGVVFAHTQLLEVPSEQLRKIENLTSLSIYHSPIQNIEFAFSNMPHLKNLFFVGTDIALNDNSFSGLESSLEVLFLRNNTLATYHGDIFKHLESLESLNLDENNIDSLPANMFEGFSASALRVSMTSNKISNIHVDAFKKVGTNVSLTDLNLINNKITNLDFLRHGCNSVLLGSQYDDLIVHLNSNPINCNCELYDLAKGGLFTSFGECKTPSKYEGQRFSLFGAGKFERKIEEIYGRIDGDLGIRMEEDCAGYNLTIWNKECLVYNPKRPYTSDGHSVSNLQWIVHFIMISISISMV